MVNPASLVNGIWDVIALQMLDNTPFDWHFDLVEKATWQVNIDAEF